MKHFRRFIAVRSRMNEDLGVIHVYLLLLLFVRALGTKNVFTHSGSSSPILYNQGHCQQRGEHCSYILGRAA